MSRFSFEQDENGPFLYMTITSEGESTRLRLDWETTAMFTHRDQDRHYDHVFVEMEEQEDQDDDRYRAMGAFIWRQVLPDWDDLAKTLIVHDFQHIHSPYPSPHDVEAYEKAGLIPESNFIREDPTDPKVIEEVEDDDVVIKSLLHIDDEISWFLNDTHFFDKREPRNEN